MNACGHQVVHEVILLCDVAKRRVSNQKVRANGLFETNRKTNKNMRAIVGANAYQCKEPKFPKGTKEGAGNEPSHTTNHSSAPENFSNQSCFLSFSHRLEPKMRGCWRLLSRGSESSKVAHARQVQAPRASASSCSAQHRLMPCQHLLAFDPCKAFTRGVVAKSRKWKSSLVLRSLSFPLKQRSHMEKYLKKRKDDGKQEEEQEDGKTKQPLKKKKTEAEVRFALRFCLSHML